MKALVQIEVLLKNTRLLFSRSRWLAEARRSDGEKTATIGKGLILIQVDGLSRTHFETALSQNRMPFLKKLLDDENYKTHSLYSGLPSSTPSVQGELFYGVKCAVPAFSFLSRQSGRILRMYDAKAVKEVEKKLREAGGEPLLSGGSSYSNIYTGGADEVNFCPSSPGWTLLSGDIGVAKKTIFFLLHFYSFVRVLVLLVLELAIASLDFFRGIIRKGEFFQEIKFVPIRVAICILLRELITIGVKFDIDRSIPVIHLNLIAYDEQSHRRGPNSKFAYWALKGIDDSILRIWRAARLSRKRHYDIWIYSDHGQEQTIPYADITGVNVANSIENIYHSLEQIPKQHNRTDSDGIQLLRVTLLGGTKLQRFFSKINVNKVKANGANEKNDLNVVAMGPVGFIYLARKHSESELERFAFNLVNTAKIPTVIRKQNESLLFYNKQGVFNLAMQAEELFGKDHPFLSELTEDMLRLCRHPDAGDLVILGWEYSQDYISFPREHGSHAGPGCEETHAFALLPLDAPVDNLDRQLSETNSEASAYLKIADVRNAALRYLDRTKIEEDSISSNLSATTVAGQTCGYLLNKKAFYGTLRLMTYNVHSCIGMDGILSTHRIARLIAQYRPDIVALQELDAGRHRSDYLDQAHAISEHLEMVFHFHPAIHVEEERYGDAILTRWPITIVKAENLSKLPLGFKIEPRGAIWASVNLRGNTIQIINSHLGLSRAERRDQTRTLLSNIWLNHPNCTGPKILCGDFNAMPNSSSYRAVTKVLRDVQRDIKTVKPQKTFYSRCPTFRIDHVFISKHFLTKRVIVPRTELAKVASDHLPLIVDLQLIQTDS